MSGRRFWRRAFTVSACLGLAASFCGWCRAGEIGLASSPYTDRWVYCSVNLQVDKSTDDLIAVIERASRAGTTASC